VVRHIVLAVCVVAMAAACSGDDDEAVVTDAPPSSAGPAGEVEGGECEALQVLLKLDVTDEEQDAVKEKVEEVGGVTAIELRAPESEGEPAVFLVATESQEAADAVGKALAGDPGVVSVVHPEQVC
jgi:hypothetical protein